MHACDSFFFLGKRKRANISAAILSRSVHHFHELALLHGIRVLFVQVLHEKELVVIFIFLLLLFLFLLLILFFLVIFFRLFLTLLLL